MASYVREALVVRLLDQLLGPYVVEMSRDKLQGIGMWSGNLVLTDLTLREDALDGRARQLTNPQPGSAICVLTSRPFSRVPAQSRARSAFRKAASAGWSCACRGAACAQNRWRLCWRT